MIIDIVRGELELPGELAVLVRSDTVRRKGDRCRTGRDRRAPNLFCLLATTATKEETDERCVALAFLFVAHVALIERESDQFAERSLTEGERLIGTKPRFELVQNLFGEALRYPWILKHRLAKGGLEFRSLNHFYLPLRRTVPLI